MLTLVKRKTNQKVFFAFKYWKRLVVVDTESPSMFTTMWPFLIAVCVIIGGFEHAGASQLQSV